VPFVHGAAERLYESLRDELRRRGHEVEVVTLPLSGQSRLATLKSALAWRLVDLEEIAGECVDLVIATRFPSYLVRHPNKVVWLIGEEREASDLLGLPLPGAAETAEDRRTLEMVRAMDRRALGEARALFSRSAGTVDRLLRDSGPRATLPFLRWVGVRRVAEGGPSPPRIVAWGGRVSSESRR
jgi:hypothetical protein